LRLRFMKGRPVLEKVPAQMWPLSLRYDDRAMARR
jgi:hypothetical protein